MRISILGAKGCAFLRDRKLVSRMNNFAPPVTWKLVSNCK